MKKQQMLILVAVGAGSSSHLSGGASRLQWTSAEQPTVKDLRAHLIVWSLRRVKIPHYIDKLEDLSGGICGPSKPGKGPFLFHIVTKCKCRPCCYIKPRPANISISQCPLNIQIILSFQFCFTNVHLTTQIFQK